MNELQQLEHELAYGTACADIECHCTPVHHSGEHHGTWWNISSAAPEDEEFVHKAVRYLEIRKLLVRHPVHGNQVRIRRP